MTEALKLFRRAILAACVAAVVGAALPAMAQKPVAVAQAKPRVHVVAFALWGDQDLFRREATAAAEVIATRYGHSGQLIIRANTKSRTTARIADLRDTLLGLASTAERNEDILFLFLTSHGAQDGLGVKTFDTNRVVALSPDRLGGIVRGAGIKHRIVVISACYSGIFADQIADDYTLVITAADRDHSSFGCNDDNPGNWTYFGEAFFAENLKSGVSIDDAFNKAKASVGRREQTEKLEGSNPQMKGGAAVRRQLARLP